MSSLLTSTAASVNSDSSLGSTREDIFSQISWTAISANKGKYCLLVLFWIWLMCIGVGLLLITIVFNSRNHQRNEPIIAGISILTYERVFFGVLIIFLLTILFICVSFTFQYFFFKAPLPLIYSFRDKQKVPAKKHVLYSIEQNPKSPFKYKSVTPDISKTQSSYHVIPTPKSDNKTKTKSKKKKKKKVNKEPFIPAPAKSKLPRNKYETSRCRLMISLLLTNKWTLYSIIGVITVLFHLLHVIILIISISITDPTTSVNLTNSLIQIVYHSLRSIIDVYPGICLMLYWKAKSVYDPYEPYIKKYEKKIISLENNDQLYDLLIEKKKQRRNIEYSKKSRSTTREFASKFIYKDNTKTLAAVHSLLSSPFVRSWLFFAIGYLIFDFLFYPALQSDIFQEFIDAYQCSDKNDRSSQNFIYFVISLCILRPFNGMLLIYSIFLTLPVRNSSISTLNGIKSMLSPTIIGIIILLELAELRFYNNELVHGLFTLVLSVIYGVTAVYCLVLLCSLMALQSKADRQRNRFHGYRRLQSPLILIEGVLLLVIYVFCIGLIIQDSGSNGSQLIKYFRECIILIFNIVSIFLLFPLRSIAIEPSITRNYFLNSSHPKYIRTFKWISLLNAITFIYSFVFISSEFGYKLLDKNNLNSSSFILSYTFSFSIPYYSLWSILQYDKWVDLDKQRFHPYQESEFSVNNPRNNSTFVGSRSKQGKASVEVSMASTQHSNANGLLLNKDKDNNRDRVDTAADALARLLVTKSTSKIIKRNKFRHQSEGGNPIDAKHNSLGVSPDIPDNYIDTMDLFNNGVLQNNQNIQLQDEDDDENENDNAIDNMFKHRNIQPLSEE